MVEDGKTSTAGYGRLDAYLHDAAGNAVSRDTQVAPPQHLQWVGSPAWTRHHDHMSSFTAMVSAAGRLFYIIDEGCRA